MNQSQHDCPSLPQIEGSSGRLCDSVNFGVHQLVLLQAGSPSDAHPGVGGAQVWGALQLATLPPGAPGAPQVQRWLEQTLLTCPCLGGYIGDGMAAGGGCCWPLAGRGRLQGSEDQQEGTGTNIRQERWETERGGGSGVCRRGGSSGVAAGLRAFTSPVPIGERHLRQAGLRARAATVLGDLLLLLLLLCSFLSASAMCDRRWAAKGARRGDDKHIGDDVPWHEPLARP